MLAKSFLFLNLTFFAVAANPPLPPSCSGPNASEFIKALDLERRHDLDRAYTLLAQQSNLCQAQLEHIARLRALLAIKQAGGDDSLILSADRARDMRALMQKFDPVQDQFLLQNAYLLLHVLESHAKTWDGSEFGEVGKQAQVAWRNRNPGLLPFEPTRSIAFTVLRYIPGVCLGILVVGPLLAFLRWKLRPRKGVKISFEDVSAEPKMKPQKDRALMQQVQEAFWVPRTEWSASGMEDLQIDSIANRDGYGFGSLIPEQPLIQWGELVTKEAPIKIGPLELNLSPFLSIITSPLQSRRMYSLVGFYSQSDDRQTLVAQGENRDSSKGRSRKVESDQKSWKVESDNKRDQRELIRDIAAQIIVDWPASETTSDWRSYRRFEEGLHLLSARDSSSEGCDCIQKARQRFEESLSFDPANWLARFYLAIALRRCGDYRKAASHLSVLEDLLKEADRLLPPLQINPKSTASPVVRHLGRYPQCPFLVLYNKAMALSDSHEPCNLSRAVALLERVVDSEKDSVYLKSARRLSPTDKNSFRMLAQSALAAVKAAELEIKVRDPKTPETVIEALQTDIARLTHSLRHSKRNLFPKMLTSRTLALGVALTAQGRAASVGGYAGASCRRFADAEELFIEATIILPDLIDAYINLGWLYLRCMRAVREDWATRAENALNKAIELDPHCTRARYLLALLHSTDERARFSEACQMLEGLRSLPEANLHLGNIYSHPKSMMFDLEKAIGAWKFGLDLIEEPTLLQIDQLMALKDRISSLEPSNGEVFAIARRAAEILTKRGKCDADRELGLSFTDQFSSAHQAAQFVYS